ncbi:putative quinol monooxygenase [Ornithinimicrobium sp. INDO-MA30-4]|uniref:putative quinol monooxygenase n=1 Tax=Ornithinimicrobium sp. INDO-MA30-4 TaxID=2908651 RepID=UPI001F19B636|nr:putative quinol monooxygenase [Ornithinimicrobium sp. INDO-MA30-4]UJH70207.1 antibiotic biosynthesis monooxygenase [Ornithinimicrobium sp. INDO-MA30-4]
MTDSLHVVAQIPTNPEMGDAVRAGLAELASATQSEDGCLAYTAYESAVAPGVFITVEEWRSQADLDAHMTTPHIAKALRCSAARSLARSRSTRSIPSEQNSQAIIGAAVWPQPTRGWPAVVSAHA